MDLSLVVVLFVLAPGSTVSGSPGCVPSTIHLGHGTVTASSADRAYQPGDIFYRNCSEPSARPYVGWRPDPYDTESRLQINLPNITAIYGIVFQTSLAACDDPDHDYSAEPFLMEFDLAFVLPEDSSGNLIQYGKSLKALDAKSSERFVIFNPPLVTNIFSLVPRMSNVYPSFRFKIIGCQTESLCPEGLCKNGGECAGVNYCKCARGYLGNTCNETLDNMTPFDHGFQSIENNTLFTPNAVYGVTGNVTLVLNKRRDDHHHDHHDHHHHECHFHSHHHHHSHCEYWGPPSPPHGHQPHGHPPPPHGPHSHDHCMGHLSNSNHPGFTTTFNAHFGSQHHGHTYLFSSGGHLQNHQGVTLSYNTNSQKFNFIVSSQSKLWNVNAHWNFQVGVTLSLSASWHPHTGAHLHINNHLSGSCGHPQNHATPHNLTVDLRLGDGHVSIDMQTAIDMALSGLNIYPTSAAKLNAAGASGPFTAAPPPTQATTPLTTTSTTAPATTTVVVSATTTHQQTTAPATMQTTSGVHRPVCFHYDNQATIGAVTDSYRCLAGEVCTLFEDKRGYTAKCLPRPLCEYGRTLAGGKCWECCDTYLCNDHCSASASTSCVDKVTCATMMATGYDVCSDPKLAVDICQKTCKLC